MKMNMLKNSLGFNKMNRGIYFVFSKRKSPTTVVSD